MKTWTFLQKNGGILLGITVYMSLILPVSCGTGGQPGNKVENTVKELRIEDSPLLLDGKMVTGWEVTNFGPQGPVTVNNDEIVLGMGDGCTGINWKGEFPEMNYEVSLEARRIDGNDFFCGMTFPVGKSPCTFIVGGWGGTTTGLSSIDGNDASENETTRLMNFEKGRWYKIRLTVTESAIEAFIDSARVVSFNYIGHRLSIRPEVELSKPFGITSWRTVAGIRNIEIIRRKNEIQ